MKELCNGKEVYTSTIEVSFTRRASNVRRVKKASQKDERQFEQVCQTYFVSCGRWTGGPIKFSEIPTSGMSNHIQDDNEYCTICNNNNDRYMKCDDIIDERAMSTACRFKHNYLAAKAQ